MQCIPAEEKYESRIAQLEEKIRDLEEKLVQVYYAPCMTGYFDCKERFEGMQEKMIIDNTPPHVPFWPNCKIPTKRPAGCTVSTMAAFLPVINESGNCITTDGNTSTTEYTCMKCNHKCVYCYIKPMNSRFGRKTDLPDIEDFPVNKRRVDKGWRKMSEENQSMYMMPSSHDNFPGYG